MSLIKSKVFIISIFLIVSGKTSTTNFVLNNQPDSLEYKKLELVHHVNNHVNNLDMSHSIVDNALKHNIDICFMLAQSKIETNYGKSGIGKRKNSIFGIVSKSYNDFTESIKDYCEMLTRNYLVNGKTEQHLLSDFVNKNGDRYAESREYEVHLYSEYHKIRSNSKIHKLQNDIILEKSSRSTER